VGDGGSGLGLGFVSRSDRGGVQAGDLLVTSGEDGVFPSGIALGRVTEASEPETGLFLHVLAEPVVRLDQLEEVLLVLDPGTGPFHAGTAPEPLPADAQAGSVDGAAAVAAGP
jgi:rod shape-determining protein MreC